MIPAFLTVSPEEGGGCLPCRSGRGGWGIRGEETRDCRRITDATCVLDLPFCSLDDSCSGVEITTYTLLTPPRKPILSFLDAAAVEAPNIQLVSLQCSLAATNRARSGEEGGGGRKGKGREREREKNRLTLLRPLLEWVLLKIEPFISFPSPCVRSSFSLIGYKKRNSFNYTDMRGSSPRDEEVSSTQFSTRVIRMIVLRRIR